MLDILAFMMLGIIVGFVTGLAPGIHPNTVFILVLSLTFLFSGLSIYAGLAFIVSLAVSNTFFDFIPSIFFGAPEEDSCLSVLPGHKMLIQGHGYEALFMTVMGGLGSIILTLLTLPILLYFIPIIYSHIHEFIHVILLTVVLWMIFTQKKKMWSAAIFLMSGLFGFMILNSYPSEQMLFPSLTGMFGISTMLISFMTIAKIPEQRISGEVQCDWFKTSVVGWFAGLIVGLLPGIGSSQAGVIAAQIFKAKTKEFLTALGGINTSNIIFTFISLYAIGKTRSGAAWALSEIIDSITINDVLIIITIAATTAFISAIFTLKAGKIIAARMRSVNYRLSNLTIIAILFVLVFFFTGFVGCFICGISIALGLLCITSGARRTNLMGFLILPTIIYFAGLSPYVLSHTSL